MSFTFVRAVAGRDGSIGPTGAMDTSGANFLLLLRVSDAQLPSPTDNFGNAWTLLGSWGQSSGGVITAHYSDGASTGPGHGVNTPNIYSAQLFMAFTRTAGTLAVGPSAGRTVIGSNAPTAGGITPAATPALVVAALATGVALGSATIPSPFAERVFADAVPGNTYGGAASWLLQNPAAAVDPAWSLGASATTSAVLLSFAVGTGSPPPPPPPPPPPAPTITTQPLRNELGALLPNTTIALTLALRLSDGAERGRWINAVTDGTGVLTLQGEGLAAVPHLVLTTSADGQACGARTYTPAV